MTELLSAATGETWLSTRGCSRKTRLTLQNVGLAEARFSVSTNSTTISALDGPRSLLPAEATELDLHVDARAAVSSSSEAELTIELEGSDTPMRFTLRAPIIEVDGTLPRKLDFAGVEVGGSGVLATSPLLGLPADFVQDGGLLQFLPRDAGHQEIAASRESMLDCPALSSVTVVGDGVPAVLYGPTEVNFGDVRVGDGIELDVAVQNLSFDEVQVALPGTDFTIVSTSSTHSIATRDLQGVLVRGSRSQRVRFSPATAGPFTGALEATAGARWLVIPLRAFGAP